MGPEKRHLGLARSSGRRPGLLGDVFHGSPLPALICALLLQTNLAVPPRPLARERDEDLSRLWRLACSAIAWVPEARPLIRGSCLEKPDFSGNPRSFLHSTASRSSFLRTHRHRTPDRTLKASLKQSCAAGLRMWRALAIRKTGPGANAPECAWALDH